MHPEDLLILLLVVLIAGGSWLFIHLWDKWDITFMYGFKHYLVKGE